jgi:hypothetical protein
MDTILDRITPYPVRPSLRRAAYTGSARKRREFSRPMLRGLWMLEGPVDRYAALGLLKTVVGMLGWRQKKMPVSYG